MLMRKPACRVHKQKIRVNGPVHVHAHTHLLVHLMPQLRHSLGHHRHDIGVSAVDGAQQLRELDLVRRAADQREAAQVLKRLDVPVAHLHIEANTQLWMCGHKCVADQRVLKRLDVPVTHLRIGIRARMCDCAGTQVWLRAHAIQVDDLQCTWACKCAGI